MQRIVLFAFLFVGITLAAVAAPAEVETVSIAMKADDFAQTTAHVTGQYTRKHPKGPSTEVIEFDYTVDGRTYHGDNHLTQFDDDKVDIDRQVHFRGGEKTIDVFYDPQDPSTVVIHRDIGLMVPLGVLGVTVACLYGSISGFVEARRARKREKEREERIAQAA